MSCGIGCRHNWDPELLWLWYRPANVAPVQPLVWELLHAASAALKTNKQKKLSSPLSEILDIQACFLFPIILKLSNWKRELKLSAHKPLEDFLPVQVRIPARVEAPMAVSGLSCKPVSRLLGPAPQPPSRVTPSMEQTQHPCLAPLPPGKR